MTVLRDTSFTQCRNVCPFTVSFNLSLCIIKVREYSLCLTPSTFHFKGRTYLQGETHFLIWALLTMLSLSQETTLFISVSLHGNSYARVIALLLVKCGDFNFIEAQQQLATPVKHCVSHNLVSTQTQTTYTLVYVKKI